MKGLTKIEKAMRIIDDLQKEYKEDGEMCFIMSVIRAQLTNAQEKLEKGLKSDN